LPIEIGGQEILDSEVEMSLAYIDQTFDEEDIED
jgi:hypothetical protein